jgi:hypothetical protein
MATREEKYPEYLTAVGTLVFPFLNRPRDYKNDGKFAYSTGLLLDGQDAADFEKLCDELVAESMQRNKTKKRAGVPYDPHTVKDEDGNETEVDGATVFKFRLPAVTKTKSGERWERKIAFLDCEGTPLSPPPLIGAGSKAAILFQVYHWKTPLGAGAQLQPKAIQIIELVEYVPGDNRSAEEMGFKKHSGGYVAGDNRGDDALPDEDSGPTDGDPESGADF